MPNPPPRPPSPPPRTSPPQIPPPPPIIGYRNPDLPGSLHRPPHPLRIVLPFSFSAALANVVTVLLVAAGGAPLGLRSEGKQVVTCLWAGTLLFGLSMTIVLGVAVLIRQSSTQSVLIPAKAGKSAIAGLLGGIVWGITISLMMHLPEKAARAGTGFIWWGFPAIISSIVVFVLARPAGKA